jgi:hypothetical protein
MADVAKRKLARILEDECKRHRKEHLEQFAPKKEEPEKTTDTLKLTISQQQYQAYLAMAKNVNNPYIGMSQANFNNMFWVK